MVRFKFDGFFETVDRFFDLSKRFEGFGQVVVEQMILRVESDGFDVGVDRLVDST